MTRSFPYRSISLELTSACNLKCPLCPHTVGKRAKKHVPTEQAIRWIREIRRSKLFREVALIGYGESMLHPGLVECVRMCRLRTGGLAGVKPVISTNGNYTVDHQALVNAGLHRMVFSIDGFTQETYEKYRVNGDIERAKRNLIDLKKHAGRRVQIIYQLIGFDWIPPSEIAQARQFCKQHGVTFELKHTKKHASSESDRVKLNASLDRRHGATNPRNPKFRFCQTPLILYTGEVAMCCRDWRGEQPLGNINDEPLDVILSRHKGIYDPASAVCEKMCPHLKGGTHGS